MNDRAFGLHHLRALTTKPKARKKIFDIKNDDQQNGRKEHRSKCEENHSRGRFRRDSKHLNFSHKALERYRFIEKLPLIGINYDLGCDIAPLFALPFAVTWLDIKDCPEPSTPMKLAQRIRNLFCSKSKPRQQDS